MADPYLDITQFNNTLITGNPYLLYEGFTAEELRRVNAELLLWKFYQGNQWHVKRPAGDPQITSNYCKAFVDKGVAFLMGKGFSFHVKPNAEQITKPILDEVWDDNNRDLIGIDMAQSGGVTGNSWVKVAIEEFDPKEQPDMYEMYPQGRIRILVLPSYSVFPTWHAHDKDKLIECKIIYPIAVYDKDRRGTGTIDIAFYKEVITATTVEEYIDDDLIGKRDNILGEIPVVRIKNLPLAGNPFGASDIQDIVPLQIELNNKATDVSDIINYHAAPITIVQGAKVGNLEKGARKIWSGIPKDGKVYNLELTSDLGAAMNYITFIKTAMFEIAHMPEDAFGKEMNISNTSGVALHIKNQPLMEQTRTKQITYGEGLKQINRLILKYASLINYPGFQKEAFQALKPLERYWTSPEFADPLPKDELIQMQLIAQKIALFLESRKDALIELGETEAAEKLQAALDEAKTIMKAGLDPKAGTEQAQTTNTGGIVHKSEKAAPNKKKDD